MSGMAPDYPVQPQDNGFQLSRRSKLQRRADVAHTGQWTVPVRCATKLSDVPIDSKLSKRLWSYWRMEAINILQPPPSMASKFSELHIHCKSKVKTLQDTFKVFNPLQAPKINSSAWRLVRGLFVLFCCSCCLDCFLLSHSYFPEVLCKASKRHLSVWWSLWGLSDPSV
jgi:hypothetical protein